MSCNEQKIESEPPINCLPNEIKFEIFHYLDVFTILTIIKLVCKSWQNLVQDDSFWKSCKSLNIRGEIPRLHIQELIAKCPFVQNLTLKNRICYFKVFDSDIFRSAINLSRLQSFTLHDFALYSDSTKHFRHFLKNSPSLISLNLNIINFSNSFAEAISEAKGLRSLTLCNKLITFTRETWLKIFDSCVQLEYLDLSQQDGLTDDIVSSLFRIRSDTLKCLILQRFHNFSDDAFTNIEYCTKLSVLRVYCHSLRQQTLERLSNLPRLHDLELFHGGNFSSGGLKEFFGSGFYLQLKYLSLGAVPSLFKNSDTLPTTKRFISPVSLTLQNYFEVYDHDIRFLISKCPNLVILNLSGLTRLKGLFLDEISYLKSLKLLILCFCNLQYSALVSCIRCNSMKVVIQEDDDNWTLDAVDNNPQYPPIIVISRYMAQELFYSENIYFRC